MVTKSFDQTISFQSFVTSAGETVWSPFVEVTFIDANITLPFVFDTGASVTTLRRDLAALVGATRWDEGQHQQSQTAGDEQLADSYRYEDVLVEVFGQQFRCPVDLMPLPPGVPGLLGREGVFDRFGFGFWESTHKIYVTSTP